MLLLKLVIGLRWNPGPEFVTEGYLELVNSEYIYASIKWTVTILNIENRKLQVFKEIKFVPIEHISCYKDSLARWTLGA